MAAAFNPSGFLDIKKNGLLKECDSKQNLRVESQKVRFQDTVVELIRSHSAYANRES
jgi:hypothetical protein